MLKRFLGWRWWIKLLLMIVGFILLGGCGYIGLILYSDRLSDSNRYIRRWVNDPDSRPELRTVREPCGEAPFVLPSDGFIGLLWNDPAAPYNVFNRHTGIDIFGDGEEGEVPIYAVYGGYLTRLSDWVSTVIIEHDDPLNPGETIFTYYTHMASDDGKESYVADNFPPGTMRARVEQGTLLGYQGTYSGRGFPIALHVHLSIIKSDENGKFLNESQIGNTLDPSPYFGLPLKYDGGIGRPIRCTQ